MSEGPADDKPSDPTGDAVFEALWKRVEEAWDEDKPHQAVLQHALEAQRLPDLAGRYRKIKDQDSVRAARAQKRIDAIVVAATQMLMATKSPERTKTPWQWTATAAVLCAVVIAFLVIKLFVRH